jgi:lysophospholipase L1-like esterase
MIGKLAWRLIVSVVAALMLGGCDGGPSGGIDRETDWTAAWTAAPSDIATGLPLLPGQTLRQFIAPTASGTRVRLRLCNRLGTADVSLRAVSIGVRDQAAALDADSLRTLRFSGNDAVTIAAGVDVLSDPLDFEFDVGDKLGVSFSVDTLTMALPRHFQALEVPYLAVDDRVAAAGASGMLPLPLQDLQSWFLICGLEISGGPAQQTLALLGDSLTDGFVALGLCPPLGDPAVVGQDLRYPDMLSRRLRAAGRDEFALANLGISGNRVLADGFSASHGPSLLSRIDADVLSLPNLRSVVLVAGINDLGLQTQPDAATLIAGLQQATAALQAAGVRVLLGTLTPARGFCSGPLAQPGGPYVPGLLSGTAAVDTARQQVNDWIRNDSGADVVVDFDACLRDPQAPSFLAAEYDSGDHLHPNVAGYEAMTACIDLGTL